MAEMIPDSIGVVKSSTSGERRVYNLLKSVLLPDSDWIVWYEPCASIQSKHGDFLIFSKYHGIILIEVKDWSASYIATANPSTFTIKNSDGSTQNRENPLKQARSVQLQIRNLLEKKHSLRQKVGNFAGKLRFPTTECVIFTGMERAQAEKAGLMDDSILSHQKCIFQDDLRVDIDDKESRNSFVEQLLGSFNHKFAFTPLSSKELDAVRYAIFPELRVNPQQELSLDIALNNDDLIKVLDKQQEIVSKSIGTGHRILKGVAGSGKSLVVTYRARHLARFNPHWRILVVCFNISLRSHLGASLNNSHIEPYRSSGKGYIEVKHYHSLLSDLTNIRLRKGDKESWDDYNIRRSESLIDYVESQKDFQKYDAILIDEGQDFTEDMIRGVLSLLSEKDSLLFCYDPAQNIFGRKNFTWKSVGLNVQGKKPTLLNKSYRNTRQILELCTEFKGEDLDVDAESENKSLIPDYGDCREGDLPLLIQKNSFNEMIDYVAQDIMSHTGNGIELSESAIIIMESNVKRDIVKNLIPKLTSRLLELGFSNGCVSAILTKEDKLNLDLNCPSVKVIMTDSCKGLEFRNVYMMGLAVVEEDTPELRKTAYVGMTRAKDYLTVLYAKPNHYTDILSDILEKQSRLF